MILSGHYALCCIIRAFFANLNEDRPSQFGSRKVRSTTHAIVLLHSWMSCLDSRGSMHTTFVDICKAFDFVNHSTLLRNFRSMVYQTFYLCGLVPVY